MIYIASVLLLLCTQSYAWNLFSSDAPKAKAQAPQTQVFEGEPPKCLSKREQFSQNIFRCPEPSELEKKDLKWIAGKGWKGYQDSFATEISKFLGSQWRGVGVGRIVCLYETNDISDFPVQISSQRLTERPSLPRWENNPQASVVNCISLRGSTCECAFSYYIQDEEQDLEKIIQGIDK